MPVKAVFKEIELRKISPNRLNPRLEFNKEALDQLADSIQQIGLIQPIVLRPRDAGFEVVVGERRYRAAHQAGLKLVPAIIRPLGDEEVIMLNLIENIQREELTDVEKGNCCVELRKRYPGKYPTNEVLGKELGVSGSSVQRWMQIVRDVPRELQTMIASVEKRGVLPPEGKITSELALDLTRRIAEPRKRIEAAKELARRSVPQRLARRVVKQIPAEPKQSVSEIIETILEKEESEVVSEIDTNETLDCPICHARLRLIHKEPRGHVVEEVREE
ncbi:MAG: ParB/RepB/Spo0J family partition protein [Thermoplasmata archaeon]|nr:ParB/RepB/Spo0J family partition protein [Thermoplasmata archaeon]